MPFSAVPAALVLAAAFLLSCNPLQSKEYRFIITDTQGRSVEGRLLSFSVDAFRLAPDPGSGFESTGDADGEILFSRTELLSLRNLTPPPATSPTATAVSSETSAFSLENFPRNVSIVTLSDGTSFVVSDYTTDSRTATLTRVANLGSLSLPVEAVAHVRFQVETASLALEHVKTGAVGSDQVRREEEWTRLLRTPAAEDRLVVVRADALDTFPGIVLGVDEKAVRFESDGEILPIPRARVAGIIYHQGPQPMRRPEIAVLHDRTGSRIALADFTLDMEKATLSWVSASGTPSGVLPLDLLSQIELPQWNLVALSSLKPVFMEQSPFFTWGDVATEPGSPKDLFQRLTVPRFGDRNDGKANGAGETGGVPQSGDTSASPARLDGRSFDDALVLRARTLLRYDLNGAYIRLRGRAGVDDHLRPGGRVRLRILGDEAVLFDEVLRGDKKARPLDLALDGVGQLAITVDFPDGFDGAAQVVLADVKLTKP